MQTDPVGVFYAGQDFSVEPPAFFVERRVAREWLHQSRAWSIHHGRDIALDPEKEGALAAEIDTRKLTTAGSREESCVMGEHVMVANAEEKIWARRMVRSWNRRVAMEEHLRSLRRYQNSSS
ncbi:MAG TPA: hypothetical protein VI685_26880 [Candidatus Angelobacter sp.]